MNTTLADHAGIDILIESRLGSIAQQIPGATAVLRRHKLDFCCGGDATLADAARERGDDAAMIAGELCALAPRPADAPEEAQALIDHILERYHETHRRELPELIFMVRKVEEVHAGHPELPKALSLLLEHIAVAIEEHMQKEERILFPMIRTGLGRMAVGPIAVMRHEHVEHGERLRQLEELTRDHTPPADACTTWRALYAGTRKLVDDVMQHIHLENNVLFPQFGPDDA
jgi:regulator of cell morphogenesis and NO signaling